MTETSRAGDLSALRKAFNIMRNRANADGTSGQNFWSDFAKLRSRGWSADQGAWQWDPLPAASIVKWNVPFKPEQLGAGNYFRMQEEAASLGCAFNMRQRIREQGKLQYVI